MNEKKSWVVYIYLNCYNYCYIGVGLAIFIGIFAIWSLTAKKILTGEEIEKQFMPSY